jgi:hypothetical protein
MLFGCLLAVASPVSAADLGPGGYVQPLPPPPSKWEFSFTPYGWFIGIDGNATAAGHTANIDKNFIQIAEESDYLTALMGYFEARKGRFGVFTDVVWADLGFPGNYQFQGSPFSRFPGVKASIKGNAQLDYESTIIQAGAAYELAKWQNGPSYTALDVMASARYWNEDTNIKLNFTGKLDVDFKRLGLKVRRSRNFAVAGGETLEWVDPVGGLRLRHRLASGSDLNLTGGVGGFGAGSDFSWQAVGTYGFDVTMFGTTMRSVVGYRALSVDYSENGKFGKNGIDWIQHGPLLGAKFSW